MNFKIKSVKKKKLVRELIKKSYNILKWEYYKSLSFHICIAYNYLYNNMRGLIENIKKNLKLLKVSCM